MIDQTFWNEAYQDDPTQVEIANPFLQEEDLPSLQDITTVLSGMTIEMAEVRQNEQSFGDGAETANVAFVRAVKSVQ